MSLIQSFLQQKKSVYVCTRTRIASCYNTTMYVRVSRVNVLSLKEVKRERESNNSSALQQLAFYFLFLLSILVQLRFLSSFIFFFSLPMTQRSTKPPPLF